MSFCKHEQHQALGTCPVSGSGTDDPDTVKERERPTIHCSRVAPSGPCNMCQPMKHGTHRKLIFCMVTNIKQLYKK